MQSPIDHLAEIIESSNRFYWGTREESRKSWDHIVSNEIVYVEKSRTSEPKIAFPFAKFYIKGTMWCELQIFLVGQRNAYFKTVIELFNERARTSWNNDLHFSRIDRNDHVLVNVGKPVELPEGVFCVGRPSVIRLKRIDCIPDCLNLEMTEALPELLIGGVENGELNFSGRSPSSNIDQLPCQLIQTGPQGIDELAKQHSDAPRYRSELRPADVPSLLRIFFLRDGVSLFTQKNLQFPIERIEVFFRPVGFHLSVQKSIHDLAS